MSAEPSVSAAVDLFLADVDLGGVNLVRAALARRLAAALDSAPDYALARLAVALEEQLSLIGRAVSVEGTARDVERLLRQVR
jgi:hypothetical protein